MNIDKLKENIIYEDNHLLIVYKNQGILSQKDITNSIDLLTLYKEYLRKTYKKLGNVYLGLVHRLDRNTTGIVVLAKTSKCASRLSESIRLKEFKKEYLCVVDGIIDKNNTLVNYLKKDEIHKKSIVTNNHLDKEAILDYEVIDTFNNETLLKVSLHTGRFHQIRCQLSNINHPVKGDTLYGNKVCNHLYLHAYKVTFPHPITKEIISFNILPKEDYWIKYLSKL